MQNYSSLFSGYYYSSLYIFKADLLSWALSWYWTCLNCSTWLDIGVRAFFKIISGEEMWILELQSDSKMLNVSLRRPPFHTCSSNKDPLSHIYFLPWILSQFDSQQGVKLGVFIFIFRCMYTSKLQTQDSCFLSFELVTLLFKSSLILFCPNYNGVDAN